VRIGKFPCVPKFVHVVVGQVVEFELLEKQFHKKNTRIGIFSCIPKFVHVVGGGVWIAREVE
jgi:hypothetical protein